MRCAPDEEELDRDERTLDVIFWVAPVAAGAAVGLPMLIGLAVLLRVSTEILVPMVYVGVPALATIVFGIRHALTTRSGSLRLGSAR